MLLFILILSVDVMQFKCILNYILNIQSILFMFFKWLITVVTWRLSQLMLICFFVAKSFM